MKDVNTKNKFLELRAQGKSLRTIADELEVGRQTLVNWAREYKDEIENMKAVELDAMHERYRLTTQAKLERYGTELRRVTEELEKRDLSDVPTPKLYDIMIKLHARIEETCPALAMRDEDELVDRRALRELVASRSARNDSARSEPADQCGNGDGTVGADDLVTVLLITLQRFKAGEIDKRAAMTEIALVKALLKGIELTSVCATPPPRYEYSDEELLGLFKIIESKAGPDAKAQDNALRSYRMCKITTKDCGTRRSFGRSHCV